MFNEKTIAIQINDFLSKFFCLNLNYRFHWSFNLHRFDIKLLQIIFLFDWANFRTFLFRTFEFVKLFNLFFRREILRQIVEGNNRSHFVWIWNDRKRFSNQKAIFEAQKTTYEGHLEFLLLDNDLLLRTEWSPFEFSF